MNIKLHALFLCGWLLIGGTLSSAQVHGPSRHFTRAPVGPKIRVLLEKDTPSAMLEARGPYRVIRRDSGSILSSGSTGKRFVVHALQNGLRWGEEYPDIYQISVVPLAPTAYVLLNGIQYKGAVTVYHVRDNHITIVNETSIEDYLKSSLAIQFEESISKEAMAALAIAARTEAYTKALQGASTTKPWDVVASEVSYYGYGVTQQNNGVEEAVDFTKYMVLESMKPSSVQNFTISATKADELAKKGYDAQKILKSTFPHAKLGSTIFPDEGVVR